MIEPTEPNDETASEATTQDSPSSRSLELTPEFLGNPTDLGLLVDYQEVAYTETDEELITEELEPKPW